MRRILYEFNDIDTRYVHTTKGRENDKKIVMNSFGNDSSSCILRYTFSHFGNGIEEECEKWCSLKLTELLCVIGSYVFEK